MKHKIVQIALWGIMLLIMVSAASLVSVKAHGNVDLPPRPTPKLDVEPEDKPDPKPDLSALAVSISADNTHADVGDLVRFTITLTNSESEKKNGLKLLGLIPAALDITQASATRGSVGFKTATGRVQVNNIGSLEPGSTVTVTVLARVNKLAENGAKYYAAAKVTQGNGPNSGGQFSNWLPINIGAE